MDVFLTNVVDGFYNWAIVNAFATGHLRLRIPFNLNMEIEVPIQGKLDFWGVNYYTRSHIQFELGERFGLRFFFRDATGKGLTDSGWEIYPQGLAEFLRRLGTFGLPIIITENGIADAKDANRVGFITEHLRVVQRAQADGVPVRGYFHWSLVDNFEWYEGFEPRFGLYQVDYQTLERVQRPSATILTEWTRSNS